MDKNDANRLLRALNDIGSTLDKMCKGIDAIQHNAVEFGKNFKEWTDQNVFDEGDLVDLDQMDRNIQKLQQLRELTEKVMADQEPDLVVPITPARPKWIKGQGVQVISPSSNMLHYSGVVHIFSTDGIVVSFPDLSVGHMLFQDRDLKIISDPRDQEVHNRNYVARIPNEFDGRVFAPGAFKPTTVPLKDSPGGNIIGTARVEQDEQGLVAHFEVKEDGSVKMNVDPSKSYPGPVLHNTEAAEGIMTISAQARKALSDFYAGKEPFRMPPIQQGVMDNAIAASDFCVHKTFNECVLAGCLGPANIVGDPLGPIETFPTMEGRPFPLIQGNLVQSAPSVDLSDWKVGCTVRVIQPNAVRFDQFGVIEAHNDDGSVELRFATGGGDYDIQQLELFTGANPLPKRSLGAFMQQGVDAGAISEDMAHTIEREAQTSGYAENRKRGLEAIERSTGVTPPGLRKDRENARDYTHDLTMGTKVRILDENHERFRQIGIVNQTSPNTVEILFDDGEKINWMPASVERWYPADPHDDTKG